MEFYRYKEKCSFDINEIPVSNVISYRVSEQWDTQVPENDPPVLYYLITFRKKYDERNENEYLDFFGTRKYYVVITNSVYKTTYSNGTLVSVVEELDKQNEALYQEVTVRCAARTRVKIA